ncbi:hypothetical protein [Cytobacillus purgationiresistens]|uniref:Uncharacterized protein n=1 Tax=Cytobacillus purgationiresistens TaxID=863449 RepID=A0ABU0AR60_9BACI|nr:hypothetical protein [Cytobacillus purgationiresistens]MDQ0273737.1 hypothetical protein [Cytobacillus purgationiresistens]
MRRKISITTGEQESILAQQWVECFIRRMVVEQLDIPHRLKAKLLYQSIRAQQEEN